MAQYIVWDGLSFKQSDMKDIKKFMNENNWGTLVYKYQWKTLPGFGGSGGRNDVLFLWKGTEIQLSKFSIGRFRLTGVHWLGDYVNNNKQIIPSNVLQKLRLLVKKTGDYEEIEEDNGNDLTF